jgi:C4-dicarboxylate transporter, DctM subunit
MVIHGIGSVAWGIIMLASALILLFTGIPVWVALASLGLLFLAILNPSVLISGFGLFESLNDANLLVIPLFIFLAECIAMSGATETLFDAIKKWFNWMPGAVGITSVVACMVFGAISGSGPASAAAVGGSGIPEMRKQGYPPPFAGALIAIGASIAILIPPSVVVILYAVVNMMSVGSLFLAGIVPGLVLLLLEIIFIVFYYKIRIEKQIARPVKGAVQPDKAAVTIPQEQAVTWSDRFIALARSSPVLLLIIIVIGSIIGGFASPSEAAGVGAVLAFIIALVFFKAYRPQVLKKIFTVSVIQGSMIMIIMAAALLFGKALTNAYAMQAIAEAIESLSIGKWGIFIIVNLFAAILGMFLPPAAVVILVGDVLVNVIKAVGFDPLWYCPILMLVLQIGLAMPTVGLNMIMVKHMLPDFTMGQLAKAALPLMALIVVMIIILCIFPPLATWLPRLILPT